MVVYALGTSGHASLLLEWEGVFCAGRRGRGEIEIKGNDGPTDPSPYAKAPIGHPSVEQIHIFSFGTSAF